MEFLIVAFIGYALGSVPFGLVLTKVFMGIDIRTIGSKNIGATNVLRTGNKPLALATVLLDSGKGAIAVFIMSAFFGFLPALVSGLFALIGHCYPVWLKFKGGKGVATTLGTLLAAVPIAGIIACLTWLIVAVVTKYSSLSALLSLLIAPLVVLLFYGGAPAVICCFITALVFWKHRENIRRLRNGTETKINLKKKNDAV